MSTIQIVDVGPIKKLDIPVPENGGVVVLQGRNGAGKSEALEAVECAVSGKGNPKPRDGIRAGSIRGLGVELSVGRSVKRSGELVVHSMDSRLSVADLVDPGIKDPDAADQKRIKSLIALSGVSISRADYEALLPGKDFDRIVSVPDGADPLIMASIIKGCIEAEARRIESQVDQHRGKLSQLAEQIKGIDLTPVDVEEVSSRLHRLIAEHARAEAAKKAWDEHEKLRVRAQEELSTLPHVFEDYQSEINSLENQIEELKAKVNTLRHSQKLTAQLAEKVSSLKGILSTSLDPVTDEDVALLGQSVQACTIERDRAFASVGARKAQQEIKAVTSEVASMVDQIDALRGAASKVSTVLSDAVGKLGVPLRVEDNRLVLSTPRGPSTKFADLSHGERWAMSMDMAICCVGAGGLLVIPQEAWESLDPDNRNVVAAKARASGVVVLTAESTSDEEIVSQII